MTKPNSKTTGEKIATGCASMILGLLFLTVLSFFACPSDPNEPSPTAITGGDDENAIDSALTNLVRGVLDTVEVFGTQSEARRCLVEYLDAWKEDNAQKMFDLSQLTWKSRTKDIGPLKEYLFASRLTSYIIFEERGRGCVHTFSVGLVLVLPLGQETSEEREIRVIAETSPYRCDTNGIWGVSPVYPY